MYFAGEFEKVSFQQFCSAVRDAGYHTEDPLPPAIEADLKRMWEAVPLPARATSGSAGYDFHAPYGFCLGAGSSIKIPTGIRVKIEPGWWLSVVPRSSLGFKYQVHLANTLGVIDSDYYFSDNEGQIFLKLVNGGEKELYVSEGDRIAQGIFLPYGITHSDQATGVRNGGFGSTDRKA